MFKKLVAAIDAFRGTGEASVAIPLFDGALKANNVLDEAQVLCHAEGITDIATAVDAPLYISAGNQLLRAYPSGELALLASFEKPIRAIAAQGGKVALAFEGEIVLMAEGSGERTTLEQHEGAPLVCPTALSFSRHRDCLYVAQGSIRCGVQDWKRDLMTHGAGGRVVRWDFASNRSDTILDRLQWCNGVLETAEDELLVSESWAHRLRLRAKDGRSTVVYADLPGYPARVSRAADGGYWLSLFARRTQLIEFVLREPAYCERMLETIPEPYWIAPSFRSGSDFLEPLQFGAVRQMGILKPWAPSNSYGIVVKLDAHFVPQYSHHSRAGGRNHGTVSAVEADGRLYVVARGSDNVLVAPARSNT